MKKFVFLFYGFIPPTTEIMEDWNNWFAKIGDKIADRGYGFTPGIEVTKDGTKALPFDEQAITAYMVFNAENLEEAESIAKTCPMITSVRVYETRSM